MAKVAPFVVGAGLLALAFITASSGKTPDNKKRDPFGPIPIPVTDEDLELIDQTICDCWKSIGNTSNMDTLRACAASTLHPEVPWPPIPEDHATVHAVWELFSARTQSFLGATDKEAWCAGDVGPDPIDIIEELIQITPMPGNFYYISSDPKLGNTEDSLSRIVRDALNSVSSGAGQDKDLRMDYIRCVTSGPRWNWPLYASSSFSDTFPSYYGVNGQGLRLAFMPWNDDARAAIVQRRMPKRGFTQAGNKIGGVGSKFGLLWLPPVGLAELEQGIVTCGTMEWEDGSSSIDPPPEVLALVGG